MYNYLYTSKVLHEHFNFGACSQRAACFKLRRRVSRGSGNMTRYVNPLYAASTGANRCNTHWNMSTCMINLKVFRHKFKKIYFPIGKALFVRVARSIQTLFLQITINYESKYKFSQRGILQQYEEVFILGQTNWHDF